MLRRFRWLGRRRGWRRDRRRDRRGGQGLALCGKLLPAVAEGDNFLWLLVGEVCGFAAIVGHIVQFPSRIVSRYELPVAHAHGTVTLVAPPQIVVNGGGVVGKSCQKTTPLHRRCRLPSLLAEGLDASHLQHSRSHVHQVHHRLPQITAGRESLGPVHHQRRGDAPFVHPCFVTAQRSVGAAGPTGPQAEKCFFPASRGL